MCRSNMKNTHSETLFDRYETLKAHCTAHADGLEVSDDLWSEIAASIDEAIATPSQNLIEVWRKLSILLDVIDEADRKSVALVISISQDLISLINHIQDYMVNCPSQPSTPAQN